METITADEARRIAIETAQSLRNGGFQIQIAKETKPTLTIDQCVLKLSEIVKEAALECRTTLDPWFDISLMRGGRLTADDKTEIKERFTKLGFQWNSIPLPGNPEAEACTILSW